jgi:hypothetical protein
MRLGLRFVDQGVAGVIVETVPVEYDRACQRHEAVQQHVVLLRSEQPGVGVVLTLIAEGVTLHLAALQAAVSVGPATLYRGRETFELELDMQEGWRDRRILPRPVVEAILANRGVTVQASDLRRADRIIGALPAYAGIEQPLQQAVHDAQCWWYGWLGGPLFGHASRLRPWQPLDRAARARLLSGQPERPQAVERDLASQRMVQAAESTFCQSSDWTVLARTQRAFTRIAKEKGSKPARLRKMLDVLEGELPAAISAGRAQTMLVAGTHFVVLHGGVKGKQLAPGTIADYFSKHMVRLANDLAQNGVGGRDGWEYVKAYRAMVAHAAESQQNKLAAFLEAFHRFLIVVGADPLPVGILAGTSSRPPAAAVVTPQELRAALQFVHMHAETERIAAQASILLLAGYELELRTYEPWCLRLADVVLTGDPYVVIYPRISDGIGKTPSVRRTEDLKGRALLQVLSAFKSHRLLTDFADPDEDLLLGEPGSPGARHEYGKTMHLVNSALRWATGWNRASYYDLRHTVFSRKADLILREKMNDAHEAVLMFGLSAEGGHAGPSSSWAYIHWFEEALAQRCRKARPASWTEVPLHPLTSAIFPEIGSQLLAPAHGAPPGKKKVVPPASSSVTFVLRLDIAKRLVAGVSVDAIAGQRGLDQAQVLDCIRGLAAALVEAEMASESCLASVHQQISVIRHHRTWVAAAAHSKFKPICAALDRLETRANDASARELWHAWLRCRKDVHLSLERPRQSGLMLGFLMGAGVLKRSMAISAPRSSLPLPPHLSATRLVWREAKAHSSAPRYRLSIVPPHATASRGRARQVSMRGLHFWMLLLGSAILEKEK